MEEEELKEFQQLEQIVTPATERPRGSPWRTAGAEQSPRTHAPAHAHGHAHGHAPAHAHGHAHDNGATAAQQSLQSQLGVFDFDDEDQWGSDHEVQEGSSAAHRMRRHTQTLQTAESDRIRGSHNHGPTQRAHHHHNDDGDGDGGDGAANGTINDGDSDGAVTDDLLTSPPPVSALVKRFYPTLNGQQRHSSSGGSKQQQQQQQQQRQQQQQGLDAVEKETGEKKSSGEGNSGFGASAWQANATQATQEPNVTNVDGVIAHKLALLDDEIKWVVHALTAAEEENGEAPCMCLHWLPRFCSLSFLPTPPPSISSSSSSRCLLLFTLWCHALLLLLLLLLWQQAISQRNSGGHARSDGIRGEAAAPRQRDWHL